MKTWQGSIAVSELEGLVSPAYIVCDVDTSFHPRYLHYLLRSMPYVAEYRRLSYGVRPAQWDLRWDDLRDVRLLKPPTDAQEAIAGFLDRETARIDELVDKKRRLIELLKEKRTALVASAVEGPPDAEPMRLGYFVDLLPGFAFPSTGFLHDDGNGCGYRLLRGLNVKPGFIRWDETVWWPKNTDPALRRFELRLGDLVLGMDRPWIGSGVRVAAVSDDDLPSLLVQRVARLRAREPLTQGYLQLLLSSWQFQTHFEPILTGVSVPHVSPEQIGSFRFPMPSTVGQQVTTDRMNQEFEVMESGSTKLGVQLEKLAEYRQALITAAVTGQIDVAAQPSEPEEAIA